MLNSTLQKFSVVHPVTSPCSRPFSPIPNSQQKCTKGRPVGFVGAGAAGAAARQNAEMMGAYFVAQVDSTGKAIQRTIRNSRWGGLDVLL